MVVGLYAEWDSIVHTVVREHQTIAVVKDTVEAVIAKQEPVVELAALQFVAAERTVQLRKGSDNISIRTLRIRGVYSLGLLL